MTFTHKQLGIALAVIALLSVGFILSYRSLNAQEPKPAGFISIPEDLAKEYEPLAATFENAQKRIEDARKEADKVRPRIEQILRITLDRQGIKADDFGKYEFDQKLKGFKPMATPAAVPAQ